MQSRQLNGKMNSNVNIVQRTGLSYSSENGPHITNGSEVKGRVLSDNGNNSYTVSIAGHKVNVQSQVKMFPGETFSAKVQVKDGTVLLALVKTSAAESGIVSSLTANSNGSILTADALAFLQSLGLPGDSHALKLIQFMIQMGMKIDVQTARKALLLSKVFNGKEVDASQIAVLLEEKGMLISSEIVAAVMNGKNKEERKKNPEENEAKAGSQSDGEIPLEELKMLVKDYFKSVDGAATKNDEGILTLFNSLKRNRTDKNSNDSRWIILPFEWPERKINGDIRLFTAGDFGDLQKIVINCEKNVKKFIFGVYFNKHKLEKVRFSSNSTLVARNKGQYEALLKDILNRSSGFNSVKEVVFQQDFGLEGFCAEDEVISRVRGAV